jgi:hypothetical protein
LVGCSGDDPEPKFAPPSSEPPESPSTTAAAASAGPAEVLRDWVAARNRAMHTGDVSDVAALSAPNCRSCQDAIDPIKQVHAAGGWFHTPGWTVVSARIKSEGETHARVSAAIRYEAGRTLPAAGADPVAYDSEGHIVLVELAMVASHWLVEDLVYLS